MEIRKRRLKRSKELLLKLENSLQQNSEIFKNTILPTFRKNLEIENSGMLPSKIVKTKNIERGSGLSTNLLQLVQPVEKFDAYFRDIENSGIRSGFVESSGTSGFGQDYSGSASSGLEFSGVGSTREQEESGSGGFPFETSPSYKTVNSYDLQSTETIGEDHVLSTNVLEADATTNETIRSTIQVTSSEESTLISTSIGVIKESSIESGTTENLPYSSELEAEFSETTESPDSDDLQTPKLQDTGNTYETSEVTEKIPFSTASVTDSDPKTSTSSEEIVTSETISSTALNVIENFTSSMLDDMKDRHCSSTVQCDVQLNERCVNEEGTGACQCGKSFIRNVETRMCEAKIAFVGMLLCPEQPYFSELDNPTSNTFQNMMKAAEITLKLILDNSEKLSVEEMQIRVVKFHRGSLIIEWQLTIPESKRNGSLEMMAVDFEDDFSHALQLVDDSPININNATFLNISSEVDPCENAELNHCSKNAVCVLNNKSNGYECICKNNYIDVSPSPISYSGEICEAICPEGYCKNNGKCHVVQNKPVCKCQSLYMGIYCQISGLVLGSSCGGIIAVAFVILIISGKFHQRKKLIHYKDYKLKDDLKSNGSTEKSIELKRHQFHEEKLQFISSTV
ncbi:uncharacterized protein LOC111627030 [Centruroides sculpturatus]|uniref:uncharacterized protein LOC111627030 n=1 Tax=Centruroides sculpturatus TaxID=218467 RepID=UPI000C6DD412|nr:uncharacterized protein LOC111627030 [Centruroides sculpturatus]